MERIEHGSNILCFGYGNNAGRTFGPLGPGEVSLVCGPREIEDTHCMYAKDGCPQLTSSPFSGYAETADRIGFHPLHPLFLCSFPKKGKRNRASIS